MRRTFRPRHLAGALPAVAFLVGCGPESWSPPAPAGVTWQYDYQGFTERKTHVVAGSVAGPYGGLAYGGAFSFRHESELHAAGTADPFAESAPIDGLSFNEHLATQGVPLTPAAAPSTSAPASPAPSAAPPASSLVPASSALPPLPAEGPNRPW